MHGISVTAHKSKTWKSKVAAYTTRKEMLGTKQPRQHRAALQVVGESVGPADVSIASLDASMAPVDAPIGPVGVPIDP